MSSNNQPSPLDMDALDALMNGALPASSDKTASEAFEPEMGSEDEGLEQLSEEAQAEFESDIAERETHEIVRPVSPSILAISEIILKITHGDKQDVPAGGELEPFIIDVRNGNGDAAVGEPVAFEVIEGEGTFEHQDTSVSQDGSAAAIFRATQRPYKVGCVAGRHEQAYIIFTDLEVLAEETETAPETATTSVATMMLPPATAEAVALSEPSLLQATDDENTADETAMETEPQGPEEVAAAVATAPETTAALVEEANAPEPSTTEPEPTPEPSTMLPPASIPTTADPELDEFLKNGPKDDSDGVDERTVNVPRPSPIPREERTINARAQRAARDIERMPFSRKTLLIIGALMVIAMISLAIQGPAPDAAAGNALPIAPAVKTAQREAAVGAPAVKKFTYKCPEATRSTDASDPRFDTLRCTLVAQ